MTNRIKHLIVVVGFTLLTGLAYYLFKEANQQPNMEETLPQQQVEEVVGVESFNLSPQEIATLSSKAKAGEADAAFKLAEYYEYYETDWEQNFYWMKIAAEADHTLAQRGLGNIYKRKGDLEQALYWYKKAAEKGDEISIDEVKELRQRSH